MRPTTLMCSSSAWTTERSPATPRHHTSYPLAACRSCDLHGPFRPQPACSHPPTPNPSPQHQTTPFMRPFHHTPNSTLPQPGLKCTLLDPPVLPHPLCTPPEPAPLMPPLKAGDVATCTGARLESQPVNNRRGSWQAGRGSYINNGQNGGWLASERGRRSRAVRGGTPMGACMHVCARVQGAQADWARRPLGTKK